MGNVRLWVDDVRPSPEGWMWVKSVDDALRVLQTSTVVEASLDHDLGDYAIHGGDGYRIVDWMAENNIWPAEGVHVHSANPVGRERIQGVVERYGPY